ncbi:hypothetical protein AMAG_09116 [Allomyces macrogynus ATCC 38327]|uniref:MINDY deubiquitinase domain-containing protein n=1 Tax=Allomyces macrogynus (strain ATCC 38327) TaxID=578462 RepID=A0A0L0SNI6_ALLM3|nr:hypothetical protein AMAG_09116 [Allomyces macrogynus ATCC 38327]|eukprot:KNE64058.1 hypothetical protein AMAG_09116 [Allomyces macrogynus ATCC 38327]
MASTSTGLLIDLGPPDTVALRPIGSRGALIQDESLFAAIVNLLVLRGQYQLPASANLNRAQIPALLQDFLLDYTPRLPSSVYTRSDALTFLEDESQSQCVLNPHVNSPSQFDPAPVLYFLQYLDIPLVHAVLADPAEAFQTYSELDRCRTWDNLLRMHHAHASPTLSTFLTTLAARPATITPPFLLALASMPYHPYSLLYNPLTATWHLVARNADLLLLVHVRPIDAHGTILYEDLEPLAMMPTEARAAIPLPQSAVAKGKYPAGTYPSVDPFADPESAVAAVETTAAAPDRAFRDETFRYVRARPASEPGMVVVDEGAGAADQEQIDKDFAIALALQEQSDAEATAAAAEAAARAYAVAPMNAYAPPDFLTGGRPGGGGAAASPKKKKKGFFSTLFRKKSKRAPEPQPDLLS